MKARVAEIFDGIQGEGIYIGERHIFVDFLAVIFSAGFATRH